ncbi:hypothetical protein J2W68_000344 [Luteimonas terrae]|uniref:Uncharacterized protein n=1 Tax=Luteimonas terrae TaxID=1530191 RepID=A0ABU1XSB9_9GAMM|nr:hypothetical protein [Luteimonas terrae]
MFRQGLHARSDHSEHLRLAAHRKQQMSCRGAVPDPREAQNAVCGVVDARLERRASPDAACVKTDDVDLPMSTHVAESRRRAQHAAARFLKQRLFNWRDASLGVDAGHKLVQTDLLIRRRRDCRSVAARYEKRGRKQRNDMNAAHHHDAEAGSRGIARAAPTCSVESAA